MERTVRLIPPLPSLGLGLLALAVGCPAPTEPTDLGPDEPTLDATPNFECDATAVPAALPLRRLSRTQHRNTVEAFIAEAVPTGADGVTSSLQPDLAGLVADVPAGPEPHFGRLSRLDQLVSQSHVDRSYEVAVAVGTALAAPDRLWDLASDCDPSTRACIRAYIERMGPVALRRPLADDEPERYLAAVQDDPVSPDDWRDVTTLLLLAPDHLYLVESVVDDGSAHPPLDAHALASRLSYHWWQGPPDAELRALADSGALLDDATYRAQVERLAADDRARDAVAEFFSEWMGNTALEELDSRVGTPVYDAFRDGFRPGPDLRERMLAEATDSFVWTTFDNGGTWDDVLTSDRSFARTEDLASIYETPVWDGVSDPPAMTQSARAGLITRAAYTATGSANTRPIMKGVLLRTALLCDEIGTPPDNAADNPPALPENASTREFVENLTGSGSCAFCHVKRINPLGFATEDFDSLGRHRSVQRLFDSNTGEDLGTVPINTAVTPYVIDPHETVADAHDLTALFVASPKPRACLTRHWFRFTFGRMEDEATDGCALDPVDRALGEGDPLADALKAVSLSDGFRRRTLGGG